MSYSTCLNCEKMVSQYEKYCYRCIQKYNLKQDEDWHKNHHFQDWETERFEEVSKDLEEAKKRNRDRVVPDPVLDLLKDKSPKRKKFNLKKAKLGILILPLISFFSACLPASQPGPIVIERSCFIEQLPPKQSLPPVRYEHITQRGVEFLCLDPENQEAEKERELRLKQDARTCQEAYQKAIERCVKGK